VGKSWRNIIRGPGGIVTQSPVFAVHRRRSSAAFEGGESNDNEEHSASLSRAQAAMMGSLSSVGGGGKREPDFSATVNMLTMLAKADMKLKTQAREGGDGDSELDSGLAADAGGEGARLARRRSTGGGAGAGGGGANVQRRSGNPAKSPAAEGWGSSAMTSKESPGIARTDSEEQVQNTNCN